MAGAPVGAELAVSVRYQLAWNHGLCRAVLGVFSETLLEFYRRHALRRGIVEQILTHLGLPSAPVRADPVQPPPAAAANLFADTLA